MAEIYKNNRCHAAGGQRSEHVYGLVAGRSSRHFIERPLGPPHIGPPRIGLDLAQTDVCHISIVMKSLSRPPR